MGDFIVDPDLMSHLDVSFVRLGRLYGKAGLTVRVGTTRVDSPSQSETKNSSCFSSMSVSEGAPLKSEPRSHIGNKFVVTPMDYRETESDQKDSYLSVGILEQTPRSLFPDIETKELQFIGSRLMGTLGFNQIPLVKLMADLGIESSLGIMPLGLLIEVQGPYNLKDSNLESFRVSCLAIIFGSLIDHDINEELEIFRDRSSCSIVYANEIGYRHSYLIY